MTEPIEGQPVPGFPLPAQSWPGSAFSGSQTQSPYTQEWVSARRNQFVELILRQVVLAIKNVLLPGDAFPQLQDWAGELGDKLFNIGDLFGGVDLGSGSLNVDDIWSNIIETILDPLGLLARLSGGKLLDSQAPNVLTNLLFGNLLDASKLTNLSGNAGLSSENPAVVALDGRVSALESSLGSWIDNLNRMSLGANYTVLSGSVNMTGQVMESNSGVAGRVVYVDELFQSAQHYAQATAVGAPRPGRSRIAIMGDSTLATCCYIEYYAGVFGFGSQVRIVSRISGTEAIRDAANYSWSNGDVIGIGYDPASETYVGYVNNVAKVSWPDTANLVATTGRHSGLAVNLDADITTRGCAWDDYAAYDWT